MPCLKLFSLSLLVSALLSLSGSTADARTGEFSERKITTIKLDSAWSYHWGDFEFDEQGRPLGIHDETAWKPYDASLISREAQGQMLWFKGILPESLPPNPAIIVPEYVIYHPFEMYVDRRFIYRAGQLSPALMNRHLYLAWHLCRIGPEAAGQELFFRFYGDSSSHPGFHPSIYSGDVQALFERFILRDADMLVLAALFLAIGAVAFLAWIKVYRRSNPALFAFAWFACCSCINLLSSDCALTQVFFPHVVICSYTRCVSHVLFMAGLWSFSLHSPWVGLNPLCRIMRELHLLLAILLIPFDLLCPGMHLRLLDLSFLLTLAAVPLVSVKMLWAGREKIREARMFVMAFGAFAFFGLYDIVEGLDVIDDLHVKYPYGELIFLLTISYLFVLRYQAERLALQAETTRAMKDLEEQRRLVHEQNMFLEQRVNERTGELRQEIEERKQIQAELSEAKEQAEIANRAKSVFLSNMSHELRTPLNAILGYAQLLKQRSSLNSDDYNGLETIERSGHHLVRLIEDVLDLAKVETNKIALAPHPFSLPKNLETLVNIPRLQAAQKGLEFSYQPSSELPAMVEGDEKRLNQILLNLLGNAVKFTEQGRVTLKMRCAPIPGSLSRGGCCLRSQGGNLVQLHFEVSDTGPGIPGDKLEQIFTPFVQLGREGKPREGIGLGLSISRSLARLMGDDLHVTSVVGQGTTVSFTLLLPEVEAAHTSPADRDRKIIGVRGPAPRILIVDDHKDNRTVLRHMLLSIGCEAAEAVNGLEAVNYVECHGADLVLMDVMMPVLDGIQASRRLRENPACDSVKILMMTANVTLSPAELIRDSGCDAVLSKPVSLSAFSEHLQNLLRLEWIYAGTDVAEYAEQPSVLLPPEDELDTLRGLAGMHAITELIDELARLREQDQKYAPFVESLLPLIRAFRFDAPVIIYGETGTGKDLAARTLWKLGEHRANTFIPVNCAAIQEHLFESQFFGYRKGAFTGAHRDEPGYFDRACGGILFLDEIGELLPSLQAKLLRVLNNGEYTPVGATTPHIADVRIVAATNQLLRSLVESGQFREDLFHRLHVISIEMPPLRRHKEDLPILIGHLLQNATPEHDGQGTLPDDILARFNEYDWPGNVRELANEIQRYVTLNEVELNAVRTPSPLAVPDFAAANHSFHEQVEAFERQLIAAALTRADGNRTKTAELLDMPSATLYRKIQKYGL